jgi:uncharacterized membrane protein YeiH
LRAEVKYYLLQLAYFFYLHDITLLQFITYTGTFVFALTGAFKARTYKMDVFGGIVLAFVTAYGGGTLRDLLIGLKPVNWINDNIALVLVVAGTAFSFLLKENVNRFKRTIFFYRCHWSWFIYSMGNRGGASEWVE